MYNESNGRKDSRETDGPNFADAFGFKRSVWSVVGMHMDVGSCLGENEKKLGKQHEVIEERGNGKTGV